MSERQTPDQRQQMTDLQRLRHSCAHILATAVLRIWPEAQFAAGPPVENGFYYDLEMPHRLTPDDFEKIEAEMKAVIKANQPFERVVVTRDQALEMARSGALAALGAREQPSKFKLDIIQNIPDGEEITLFRNGDFTDLCAGPHVPRTGNCKAFKLTHIASAYYKGDESNPQLQRLYGTAFKTRDELDAHFALIEEAKKRDHRKLGRDLKLFHIDDAVGAGLVLWQPNGAVVRQQLQTFIRAELSRTGYHEVFTPNIGGLSLYRTSGHFPYYRESQYQPIVENDTLKKLASEGCTCAELGNLLGEGQVNGFLLKPMNCPHHIKIYDAQPRSYRDLPVRLFEFGTVYRWEQSGELSGLTRVRGFTQDDGHLFCTEEQVATEVQGCLNLVKTVLTTLGLSDYRVRVGLRDPDSSKYTGASANWDKAENACRTAAATLGVPFSEEQGEAAFYGPKIDFVIKDVLGRDWQLGTVQVDFNLPERFNLSYIGADNQKHCPVMIHRAPFGSMERFFGILIEHFAGAFPTWLSPVQVKVLPISEKYAAYAGSVHNALRDHDVRAELDESNEKIGAKIRNAQNEKVPYMLIVGEKEEADGLVSVRNRKSGDTGSVPLAQFVGTLLDEIRNRLL